MRDYAKIDNFERVLAHEKCIRHTIYDIGYDDGYETNASEWESALQKAEEEAENAYKKGLNDAWECVRKISREEPFGLTTEELEQIFNTCSIATVIERNTASEAITRIKEYEDSQNHEYIDGKDEENQSIEIGDIVNIGADRCIVTFIYNDGKWDGMTSSGSVCRYQYISDAKKTGERFDAFPLLLKNLKSASKL